MFVDPGTTDALNVYKLMIGAVVPRPIAFVSTRSRDGVLNLAPFSFFTVASADPPAVCFNPMIDPDGRRKDTLVNAEQTGEFVVNIVSEVDQMRNQERARREAMERRLQEQHAASPAEANAPVAQQTVVREGKKVGRNEPCSCGSGKKYKKCCGTAA